MKGLLKKYVDFRIQPLLGLYLALGFVVFTVIGTVSHELGHCAAAKALGYDFHLGYGYMYSDNGPYDAEFDEIFERNETAIKSGATFLEKERWEELLALMKPHQFWIRAGGPFQTILVGSIGFFLLYRRREQIRLKGMQFLDWFYVFLALFWLREWFNFMTGFVRSIVKGHFNPFKGRSDEIILARHLEWWEGSISLPLAIIAVLMALYVIFKILPKRLRLTFILAGLAGGLFGFFFWLEWVGPIVMP